LNWFVVAQFVAFVHLADDTLVLVVLLVVSAVASHAVGFRDRSFNAGLRAFFVNAETDAAVALHWFIRAVFLASRTECAWKRSFQFGEFASTGTLLMSGVRNAAEGKKYNDGLHLQ